MMTLLLPSVALAARLDVGPAAPYATIMAAHNAAAPNDVIVVAPGVYDEFLDLTKPLTIRSSGGSGVTVLRNSGAGGSVVFVDADLDLRGFEIDGQSVNQGFYVDNAQLVELSDVVVHHTTAQGGAGLGMAGGTLVITDSVFEDNATTNPGGAINLSAVNVTIERTTFARNHAPGDGGALRVYNGVVEIVDSTFVDNTSDLWGGALRTYWVQLLLIERCRFENNLAASHGGAIEASSGVNRPRHEVRVIDSVFVGNTTLRGDGGGYHGSDDNGNSLHLLKGNTFVDNEAPNGAGGGAYVGNDYDRYYYSLRAPDVRVVDNTFVSNGANAGAQLYTDADVDNGIVNNLFAFADAGPPAVRVRTGRGVEDYNLYWGNPTGDLVGRPSTGVHDVFANPLFTAWSDDGDPTNDDFTLRPGSPAINAGWPALIDGDGTVSDIGAGP